MKSSFVSFTIYKQCHGDIEGDVTPTLLQFGFRSKYSTNILYLTFYLNWKNCLDKLGIAGTVLMNLFKTFNCLPHDLIIAKLHAYGLDHDSPKTNKYLTIKLTPKNKTCLAF